MKKRLLITGLLLLLVNWTFLIAQRDYLLTVVSPDKARLVLAVDPTAILIDVRMKMEFRKKHIENAVNLPGKKEMEEFCAKTHNFRPLYIYCTTETRARQAAKLLIDKGFTNVYILEGGLSKWVALNLPTVRGTGH
jgi:rhodanese-related sulfurtransferase